MSTHPLPSAVELGTQVLLRALVDPTAETMSRIVAASAVVQAQAVNDLHASVRELIHTLGAVVQALGAATAAFHTREKR